MKRLLLAVFSHRFLALARWELHFLALRLSGVFTLRNLRIARALAGRSRPLYLNLGSGPRGLADPRWINVDGYRDRNVDFLLDMTRRLPFPDRTFDGVFCEHVLEHVTQEEGRAIAAEIRRILAPGGCWRIVVPDAALLVGLYRDAPQRLMAMRGEGATAMESLNSYFRQRYEHQFLYDWETLEAMLASCGFAPVRRAAFGEGGVPDLLLDDATYRAESLYVDALAPRA